jgi:hypothetical protein
MREHREILKRPVRISYAFGLNARSIWCKVTNECQCNVPTPQERVQWSLWNRGYPVPAQKTLILQIINALAYKGSNKMEQTFGENIYIYIYICI